jgi:hypothetical protein
MIVLSAIHNSVADSMLMEQHHSRDNNGFATIRFREAKPVLNNFDPVTEQWLGDVLP